MSNFLWKVDYKELRQETCQDNIWRRRQGGLRRLLETSGPWTFSSLTNGAIANWTRWVPNWCSRWLPTAMSTRVWYWRQTFLSANGGRSLLTSNLLQPWSTGLFISVTWSIPARLIGDLGFHLWTIKWLKRRWIEVLEKVLNSFGIFADFLLQKHNLWSPPRPSSKECQDS